jgi:hypothetical protein
MATQTQTAEAVATERPMLGVLREGEWWPYDVDVIELVDCYTDRFQRPLNERWLKKAEEEFKPWLLGTIVVSTRERRNRLFSVVDGQHRVELCRRVNQPVIAACVFETLTIQQEAALFSEFQQSRRGITAYQRFQADLVAAKPMQKAIDNIVREVGLELTEGQDGPGYIKCVVALERIYKADPAMLRTVLSLIQRTWKDIPAARSERMVAGLWRFVREEQDLDESRFVDRLSDATPSYLSQKAMQLRDGNEQMGGTLPQFLAEAISNAYRSRKRR